MYQMLDTGIFAGQRFELIHGDLINKKGQSPSHACALQRTFAFLINIFGVKLVRNQFPVVMSATDRATSEPEPDLAVFSEAKEDEFTLRHPNGSETILAIEISDTKTLRFDSTINRDLYARAGVPEYWVLDINVRQLLVHRQLDPASTRYLNIQRYSANPSTSPPHPSLLPIYCHKPR